MDFAKKETVWRLIAILIAMLLLGLPIVSLWKSVLLLLFVLAVFNAKPLLFKNPRRRNLVGLAIGLLLVILYLFPQPNIIETSNIYMPSNELGSQQRLYLPQKVARYLKNTFVKYYSTSHIDTNPKSSPWQNVFKQPNPVAGFSPEAIWQGRTYTREVQSINFRNYQGLRAGYINDNSPELGVFNFYYENNQDFLTREQVPFFVREYFPFKLVGSELCWQGNLFLQTGMTYVQVTHTGYGCQQLTKHNLPLRVMGVGFPGKQDLVVKLKLSYFWQMIVVIKAFILVGALCLLLSLFKIDYKAFAKSSGFLIIVLLAINGVHGYLLQFADTPVIEGGSDGLIYQGFGRAILYNLIHGNYIAALRGGIDIFYYMPGMRYVCALQSLFFGDTILGFLLLEIWLVFSIKRICFLLFQKNYAWIFLGFFLLASLQTFTKYAIHYNAEIAGYCFLSAAIASLLVALQKEKFLSLSVSALLFALAVMLRPNFLIGVVICLLYGGVKLISRHAWWRVLLALSPFGLVGMVAWHNFYFGHQFVPFTSSAFVAHNFVITPGAYWQAILGLLTGTVNLQAREIFYHLFHDWLNSGVFLLPFILVMAETFKRNLTIERRALLLLMFGLQLPFLFWSTGSRYTSFVWVLSYFIALEKIFNWSHRVFSREKRGVVEESS